MYVVIGAGMAGLAAARALRDAGREVVVLEARNRIGGRVHSADLGAIPVDMGASWIHGTHGNPIADLARRFGVQTVVSEHEKRHVIAADGARLSAGEIDSTFDEVLERADELADREPDDLPLSQAIARSSGDTDPRFVTLSRQMLGQIMAADVEVLSARQWDQDHELDGPDVMFPGGYSQIPRALSQGLEIRLDSPVSEIIWPHEDHGKGNGNGNGEGVRVTTGDQSIAAAAAIVTLPLGVLKAGTVRFSPPLPARKQAAIDRLGFGVSNKIALAFDRPFWPPGAQHLVTVPRAEPDITVFTSLWPAGHPVLLAWTAGRTARALEQKTDTELADIALASLSRITGEKAPAPTAILVSRWASDPYSLGAYSHIPVGVTGQEYDHLAAPISPWLYFAGEACHRQHPCTVHGAYLSGQKTAHKAMADESGRAKTG